MIALYPADWTKSNAYFIVSQVLTGCSKYKPALKFAELSDEASNTEKSKIILSKLHCELGDYQKSLDELLAIKQQTAEVHLQLGSAYIDLGYADIAEKETLTALQMFHDEACDETVYDYYGDFVTQPEVASNEKVKPDLINCSSQQRLIRIRAITSDIITCLRILSYIYSSMSCFETSHQYDQKIIQSIPITYGDNALVEDLCDLHQNEAIYYLNMHRMDLAKENFPKALALYEEMHGKDSDNVDVALLFSNLGYLHIVAKEYDRAEDYCTMGLNMFRRVLGEDNTHEDICRTLRNLGDAHHGRGDYTKAIEYYQRPLDLLTAEHGADVDHRDIADALTRLARICILSEQYQQSYQHLNKAMGMYLRLYGKDVPKIEVAAVLREFGRSHSLNRNFMLALDYYIKELEMYRKIFTADQSSLHLGETLFSIATCYQQSKEFSSAEDYLNQALTEYKKCYGKESNHPDIVKTMKALDEIKQLMVERRTDEQGATAN